MFLLVYDFMVSYCAFLKELVLVWLLKPGKAEVIEKPHAVYGFLRHRVIGC